MQKPIARFGSCLGHAGDWYIGARAGGVELDVTSTPLQHNDKYLGVEMCYFSAPQGLKTKFKCENFYRKKLKNKKYGQTKARKSV
jgi:hypothetical protein